MNNMELKHYLDKSAKKVNAELFRMSTGKNLMDKAMRYSLTAGGKRLRPILVICAAEICGGKAKDVMPAACALEYVHTYSLIHDDLPAMDNDDLRRGKPTSHKKFGEAAAILAGDALLTEAFGILAGCARNKNIRASNVIKAIETLAREAGKNGMIEGQAQDTIESGNWKGKSRKAAVKSLASIHLNKTAALIRASLKIGALLAGAGKNETAKLDNYGKNIGLAFQIADDVLDIEGNKKLLGKKGSDRNNDKLTYPALFGLKRSKEKAEALVSKAKKEIEYFGGRGKVLSALADYITARKY